MSAPLTIPDKKIVAIPCTSPTKVEDLYESLIGHKTRDWFVTHAYRCLPLTIGNQMGWVIKSQFEFWATWNGGDKKEDVRLKVKIDEAVQHMNYNTHFGMGLVTVQPHLTLRTPPGVNLLISSPPNQFIDGIQNMTAVVETDNLRRDFTFNLRLTRPHHEVHVPKGAWIGWIIPTPRYYIDSFDMVDAATVLTPDEILVEQQCMKDFGIERSTVDIHNKYQIGRRYFVGEDVYGNKFDDHQKTVK